MKNKKLLSIAFILIILIGIISGESFNACGVSFNSPLFKISNGNSNLFIGDNSGNIFINSTQVSINSVPPEGLTNSLIIKYASNLVFAFNSAHSYIRGSIVKATSIGDSGTNHLIIRNSSGANVIKFDASNNNLYFLGSSAYNGIKSNCGTCKFCGGDSCSNVPNGLDTYNECSGGFCSGNILYSDTCCNGAGACNSGCGSTTNCASSGKVCSGGACVCPSGYVSVSGVSGVNCVYTTRSSEITYTGATTYCSNRGGRVPNINELISLAANGYLVQQYSYEELWSSTVFDPNYSMKVCAWSTVKGYRCSDPWIGFVHLLDDSIYIRTHCVTP